MYKDGKIAVGLAGDEELCLKLSMANRHGLIAGATGTGKTVTLKVLAESFSKAGVPVFIADVKGDISGISEAAVINEDIQSRIDSLKISDYTPAACPTQFWDIYQSAGLPLRTTISEMGPLLLGKILELTDIQNAVLQLVFKIADDESLLLIDTKDLRAMLAHVSQDSKKYSSEYGNISTQTINAIIRAVVNLEGAGGESFFAEPALDINDVIARSPEGQGMINLIDCQKLISSPVMYSTFLLWVLSEIYEKLPEVGDLDRPKLAFFFDEAHLLFKYSSKALLEKIDQIVRLSRSKGIGIYFITQNPADIPDNILGQLQNRVQHALYAYTPAETKSVKTAAQAYRVNPAFDTYEAITTLEIGEALVSFLDEKGTPEIVNRCKIYPPLSNMGKISPESRDRQLKSSLLYSKYLDAVDNPSAYEFLCRKNLEEEENQIKEKEDLAKEKAEAREKEKQEKEKEKAAAKSASATDKAVKSATKSVANSAAGTVGREIGNTIGSAIGGSFGKRLGGNIGASLGRGIIGTLFKLK